MFQPVQMSQQYKRCITVNKYENFIAQQYAKGLYCQETVVELMDKQDPLKKNQPKLNIKLRSTNNVFEFLGQVVKAQLAEKPYLVTLPPTASTFNPSNDKFNQYALLVVEKDKPAKKSFSSIEGLDGDLYSIPSENNGYSALTIKLLSQLMSLQKIPGSIPSSPSVLLK